MLRAIITLAVALVAAPAAAGEINTWLSNESFEQVGPVGPNTSFTGHGGGGHSAAADWTVFNNTAGTTTTRLVATSLPNAGAQMLLVRTDGDRNGIVQVFLPFNTGSPSTLAQARVFVVSGQVGLGTGNGGNTGLDTTSTTTGQWELLQAVNHASPANEFIVYSSSPGGAEFFVELASVSDVVIDHLKCYDVRSRTRFQPVEVQLIDRFEREQVLVTRPTKLCTPATKCHDGLCYEPQHPDAHLTCYATEGLDSRAFQRRRLRVSNQFGAQTLVAFQRSDELCVPTRIDASR